MAGRQQLVLQHMPQQPGVLGTEDDWTGVSSSAARRRIQNRLNQRAYRKRKQPKPRPVDLNSESPSSVSQSHAIYSSSESPPSVGKSNAIYPRSESPPSVSQSNAIYPSRQSSNSKVIKTGLEETGSLERELWRLYHSAANHLDLDQQKLSRVSRVCKLSPLEQQRLISVFKRWVQHSQDLGSPRTDNVLMLVKFNVLRALISNGEDLGYAAGLGAYGDYSLSVFNDPSNLTSYASKASRALQPTKLQRQIRHHPWIDVLPSPVMRDNILRAGDTYDVMELCADLVGFFSGDKGRAGLIVWGEPWDIAGWEVTESFLENWGWTIRGCEHLLKSSNYWRKQRGERPLKLKSVVWEVD